MKNMIRFSFIVLFLLTALAIGTLAAPSVAQSADDLQMVFKENETAALAASSAAIINERHKIKITDRQSAATKPNKRRYDALCGVFFVAEIQT